MILTFTDPWNYINLLTGTKVRTTRFNLEYYQKIIKARWHKHEQALARMWYPSPRVRRKDGLRGQYIGTVRIIRIHQKTIHQFTEEDVSMDGFSGMPVDEFVSLLLEINAHHIRKRYCRDCEVQDHYWPQLEWDPKWVEGPFNVHDFKLPLIPLHDPADLCRDCIWRDGMHRPGNFCHNVMIERITPRIERVRGIGVHECTRHQRGERIED